MRSLNKCLSMERINNNEVISPGMILSYKNKDSHTFYVTDKTDVKIYGYWKDNSNEIVSITTMQDTFVAYSIVGFF